MKKVSTGILVLAVLGSLLLGGIAGFFVGVASTEAGKAFLEEILQEEQMAEVAHPGKIVRERFQLRYPSNWKVDVNDDGYDPDRMFSIDSPGSSYVMFQMGTLEMKPEDALQGQIAQFEKLMGSSTLTRFEKYGRFSGTGAMISGRIMGVRTTARLFSFSREDLTVMITTCHPDEDLEYVKDGLALIEHSFSLKTGNAADE